MMRTSDLIPPISTNGIWHAVSRLVWDTDLVASRFILAMAEFIWAIMLLLPGDTFPKNEVPHLAIFPEYVWGFIFLFSGLVQTGIILYEHMRSGFAKMFALFNAVLWVYLVLSILIDSYPPVVGIAGEITLMLTALWIWIRPYILAEGLYRVGIR
jgi:hypothetical protein